MKNKISLFLLVYSLALFICTFQITVSANTDAYPTIIQEQIDARALGMGGAFVAVADNYAAPLFNPAGISTYKKIEVGGTIHRAPWGLNSTAISGGFSINGFLGKENRSDKILTALRKIYLGSSYNTSSISVQAADSQGNPLGEITLREGSFSEVLGISVPPFVSIGGAAKVYDFTHPEIGVEGRDVTASGLGFNLGFLTESLHGLRLGAAGFVVGGTKLTWRNVAVSKGDIKGKYLIGGSYKTNFPIDIENHLLISGQYTSGALIPENIRVGAELSVWNLAIRGGY